LAPAHDDHRRLVAARERRPVTTPGEKLYATVTTVTELAGTW
jgi:hypothetical protein